MMHSVFLSALQGDKYTFVQNDSDIANTLDMLGVPKRYRKDITGCVLVTGDGDIEAAWLSESNAPYDLSSRYHPLPYYRPSSWVKRNLPSYWLESCQYYQ